MKAFSLTKFITFVSIIFMVCAGAWAQTPAAAPVVIGGKSDKQAEDDRQEARVNKCIESMEKINEAKKKFLSSCTQSRTGSSLKDCSATLDDCEYMAEDTQPIDFTGTISQSLGVPIPSSTSTGSNKCSAYSNTDYRSELREVDRDKRDRDKELKDLQKDQNKDEQEFSKDANKMLGEMTDLKKKKDEQELKDQEEERTMVSEQKKTEDQLKQKLRELNMEVLKNQNSLALLIKQKASQVEDYKIKIIQCKADVRKFLADTPKSKSGSFKSLSSNGGGRNADAQTLWETCVNKVLTQRASEAEAFRAKEAELNQNIANAQDQIQEVQKDISLIAQQAAQAAIDRANKKQKDQASFLEEYKAKYNELAAASSLMEQKRQQYQQNLIQAKMAVNEASNNLNQLKTEKPATKGSKTSADAIDAKETYLSENCSDWCAFSDKYAKQCSDLKKSRASEMGSSSGAK